MAIPEPGQKIVLDTASSQIVQYLVRLNAGTVREFPGLDHVRRIEVAHPEGADLAGLLELREGSQRLGKRDRPAPMQQIKVDGLHAKTAEAALAGGDGAFPRGIVRIHFADQKYYLPPALNGGPDEFFGAAFSIHFGGIDQGHADIDAALQR